VLYCKQINVSACQSCVSVIDRSHDAVRAYYGMEWNKEWKEKIGMEYEMAQVWNGRFDVWNAVIA